MGLYLRPGTLAEALAALADPNLAAPSAGAGRLTVLAGGTDFFPGEAARAAWLEPRRRNILDISAIDELRGIRQDAGGVRFGALAAWSEIREAELPAAFDGLKQAAGQVGGVQVQNRGTIAGNLCNASPAADGVPPLLTLDAELEIASLRGRRRLPLAQFITGNRKTELAADELVTAVLVGGQPAGARSVFLKLGARAYLVISIASVAILVNTGADGRIAHAAIALGACSPVPVRLRDLEREMTGLPCGDAVRRVTAAHVDAVASPIDDVRGSARYRRDAALVLVRRALATCLGDVHEAVA
jgi:CO/xanthine dehydrogenase FAD-binding subunit